MNGLVINLTHSVDDVDRTSVAIVVADASVASSQKTTVFLSSWRMSMSWLTPVGSPFLNSMVNAAPAGTTMACLS